jgi:hypothetical protein
MDEVMLYTIRYNSCVNQYCSFSHFQGTPFILQPTCVCVIVILLHCSFSQVECSKRVGVNASLWRKWMLQLVTFINAQNGSILDGLLIWKTNIDKHFEGMRLLMLCFTTLMYLSIQPGLEECAICYSIVHGSNYELPTQVRRECISCLNLPVTSC